MIILYNASRLLSITVLLLHLHLHSSFCLNFELQTTCNCSLEPTVETVEELNQTIDKTVTFLYLKLNFTNIAFNTTEFAYLTDTINVIDPLTWVLAIGGKGELLLQSPFDFRHVSLGTLGASGMKTRTLDVFATENFTTVSDEDKMFAIVDMIDKLTQNAVSYFHEKEGEIILRLNRFRICLEKQSNETKYVYSDKKTIKTLFRRLTENSHGVLQSTAKYTCWPVASDLSEPEAEIIPRVRAYWWVKGLVNTVVVLIVLFIPYPFFRYFDWHNPPETDKDGKICKIRIDTSPYPFGFFHFVFFSTFGGHCTGSLCSLSCWLRYIFLAAFLTIFCCVQFVPYAYVDHDNYQLRKQAAERLGVWQFGGSNIFLPFFCVSLVISLIIPFNIFKFIVIRRQVHDKDDKDWNRIGKSYLTELLFTHPDDNKIIKTLCPDQDDVFVHSPNFQDIWNIYDIVKCIMEAKQSRCMKIMKMLLVIPYWIGQAIPLIYYTNIVLVVILSLIHKRCCNRETRPRDTSIAELGSRPNQSDEKVTKPEPPIYESVNLPDQGNKSTTNVVFLCFVIPVCFLSWFVFITIPLFFQMFIASHYLIDIVGYTLVGMVVNARHVVSWMLFALGIGSFLVQTITDYSNTYIRIFHDIFKIAKSIDSKAVSLDKDNIPKINLIFFSKIAYEVKPWKPFLLMIYVKLIFAGVFFLLGYLLLDYVDGLDDLSGQSELFGAVIIGGLLPILNRITISEESKKFKEEAVECKLKQMIKLKKPDGCAEQNPNEPETGFNSNI